MKLITLIFVGMTINLSAQDINYNELKYWAAHPDKEDVADSILVNSPGFVDKARADVFFVHPTTYTGTAVNNEWNARINDESLNQRTDSRSILNQATVFNETCRIFAPRYRQAHIRAFYNPYSSNSTKAFDLAYADVKRAFEHYLANQNKGRPIIIASHSQGSLYALRILQDFFNEKPLLKQLVAAYVVGFPVTTSDLGKIPFTQRADDIGTVISWRTYKDGYIPGDSVREKVNALCVNPVSWRTDEQATSFEDHRGGYFQGFGLHKNILTARVNKELGILWIKLKPQLNTLTGNLSNYHVADYNLFYEDIRRNVAVRIEAFLRRV